MIRETTAKAGRSNPIPNANEGRGRKIRNHRESGTNKPNTQRKRRKGINYETTAKRTGHTQHPKQNERNNRTKPPTKPPQTPNAKERQGRINRNHRQTTKTEPTPNANERKMVLHPKPTPIATPKQARSNERKGSGHERPAHYGNPMAHCPISGPAVTRSSRPADFDGNERPLPIAPHSNRPNPL